MDGSADPSVGTRSHTELGDARAVPVDVPDALAWVRRLVNPPAAPAPARTRVVSPKRATLGYAFFQTWQVDRYVRKTFQPRKDGAGWLDHPGAPEEISHWVAGRDEVLLMEPLAPLRPHFEADLREVVGRLSVYRRLLDLAQGGPKGRLVAYLLAGGDPSRRLPVVDQLRPFADEVVNLEVEGERAGFVDTIRAVGSSASAQVQMSM